MPIKHRFLAGPLRFFLAPDKGGGAGGDNTPKGTLEQQLAAAQGEITTLKGSVTTLTKERDDARSEVTTIKGQFDSATKTGNEHKERADKAEADVTTLKGQLAQSGEKLTKATENATRLESLCKVKGINPESAVPSVEDTNTPGNEHVYDKWVNATGSEKTRLWRAHKKEIRAEGHRRIQNPRG